MSNLTYSVVVRDSNFWFEKTGEHVILRDCGHKHKTQSAAEACEKRLVNASCQHGTRAGLLCSLCRGRAHAQQWSANWYHSAVEDSNGNVVEYGD